jgi:hypothetical protein
VDTSLKVPFEEKEEVKKWVQFEILRFKTPHEVFYDKILEAG